MPPVPSEMHVPSRFRSGWQRLAAAVGMLFFLSAAGFAQTGSRTAPTTDVPNNARLIAEATNHLGHWIWAAATADKQTVRLWKSFSIPTGAQIVRAPLWIAADNGYRLFLDGREIGQGSDWRWPTRYDIKSLLRSGKHVLGVEAFNDALKAGLIFGLEIELSNRQVIRVVSDDSWRVASHNDPHWQRRTRAVPDWPPAEVVGNMDQPPWVGWPMGVIIGPALRPVTVSFWQAGWFQIALLSACGLAVLGCLWLLAQLAGQSKAQRLLHLQRGRIARDIHDDLGARLTQLVLLGELAQHELPLESETRRQIDRLCESARELANAMDEVVWAVSSRRDTLRDFANFACKYAQLYLKDTAIRCRLDVEPDLPALPFDLPIRRNLLLAVKEAISNTAKHSEATELFLRIHRRNGGVGVVVEDNGKGFDPTQTATERNGMTNMAERMREVGGRFLVHSLPGAGCRVEFTLPLTHGQRRPRWLSRVLGDAVQAHELEPASSVAGTPAQAVETHV